jgi:FMN phosphatase YigB (HAD superfamily)
MKFRGLVYDPQQITLKASINVVKHLVSKYWKQIPTEVKEKYNLYQSSENYIKSVKDKILKSNDLTSVGLIMEDFKCKTFKKSKKSKKSLNLFKELTNIFVREEIDLEPTEDFKAFVQNEDIKALIKNKKFLLYVEGSPSVYQNILKEISLYLPDYFTPILYCQTDPIFYQPSKVPYQDIMSKTGSTPSEITYIGTNPLEDFITPNKLGMKTIQIKQNNFTIHPTEEHKAQYIVNSLVETLNLINEKELEKVN